MIEKNKSKSHENFQSNYYNHEDSQYNYNLDSQNNLCVAPTKDNPFGNVLLSDYTNDPNIPPACDLFGDIDQHGTMDQVEEKFGENLYRNVDDVFGRTNSQRQFYTNPSTTIPNDQSTFARWLYGDAKSCKDNPYDCVPYERLQQNKFQFPDPTQNPTKEDL